MTRTELAQVIHSMLYSYATGLVAGFGRDPGMLPWELTESDLQAEAVEMVTELLANPPEFPAQVHDVWVRIRRADGWTYGPIHDYAKKTHPNLRPFIEIPNTERAKDFMVLATVNALKGFVR